MSVESEKADAAVERFKNYRQNQSNKLAAAQKLADVIEKELQHIANFAGVDPVSGQPIFRTAKHMPDYSIAWGMTISPIAGLAATLTLDRAGEFLLNLGGAQAPITPIQDPQGFIWASVGGGEPKKVSEIVLSFLADQLNKVVETKSVF